MKSHARVVVIGGGAVGCSALSHLTRLGWTDAVLLERAELTAGSTWHAAGNCPNFSTSWNILKLQRHSTALYEKLAQEVGYDINYHLTGSIRLAHTADRVDEFRHVAAQARAQHLDFELLSPSEIKARHPFLELDGIRLGLWDPRDGDIDPAQLTQALAKGARALGATVYRHTRVTAIRELSAGGWRIETPAGTTATETRINCAPHSRAPAAARISGCQAGHQRSEPVCAGRQPAAGAGRGWARLLPLLCVHFRDRTSRRCRPGDCGMGRQWRAGLGRVATRLPSLLSVCEQKLRSGEGPRDVSERIRHRLPAGGAPGRPAGENLSSLRSPALAWGGVRRARRLGARGVLRQGRRPGRPRVLVPPTALASGHRARVHRGRQRRRAGGSARLYEVSGRGRRRCRLAGSPDRRPAARRGPHGPQVLLLAARGHRERDDRVASCGWAFLVDVRGCRRASRRSLAPQPPVAAPLSGRHRQRDGP